MHDPFIVFSKLRGIFRKPLDIHSLVPYSVFGSLILSFLPIVIGIGTLYATVIFIINCSKGDFNGNHLYKLIAIWVLFLFVSFIYFIIIGIAVS